MNMDTFVDPKRLNEIYGNDPGIISYQQKRITDTIKGYEAHFGNASDLHVFSAAGRSEIGGNHTDHQRGQVLAASLQENTRFIDFMWETRII